MRQPGQPIPPLFPSPARPRLPFPPVRGPSPHSPRAQAQLSPRLPPTDQPGPQASRSSRKHVARTPTDRVDQPVIALLPLSFSSVPTEPDLPAGDLARVPHGTPSQDPRRPLIGPPRPPLHHIHPRAAPQTLAAAALLVLQRRAPCHRGHAASPPPRLRRAPQELRRAARSFSRACCPRSPAYAHRIFNQSRRR